MTAMIDDADDVFFLTLTVMCDRDNDPAHYEPHGQVHVHDLVLVMNMCLNKFLLMNLIVITIVIATVFMSTIMTIAWPWPCSR